MTGIRRGTAEIIGAEDTPVVKLDKGQIATTITGQLTSLIASLFSPQASPGGGNGVTSPYLMPVIVGGMGILAVTILATGRKRK